MEDLATWAGTCKGNSNGSPLVPGLGPAQPPWTCGLVSAVRGDPMSRTRILLKSSSIQVSKRGFRSLLQDITEAEESLPTAPQEGTFPPW